MPPVEAVTRLLREADEGDRQALDRLLPLVYEELRGMAHRHLQREYGARTLSTTALVHEAYLKLVDQSRLPVRSRAHFFGSAARAMRQILIGEARKRNTLKRGGDGRKVTLNGDELAIDACAQDLLALDDALQRLAALDERLARVVECRFFGGLSVDETAEVVDASPSTVKRDWRKARAWLYNALHGLGLAE